MCELGWFLFILTLLYYSSESSSRGGYQPSGKKDNEYVKIREGICKGGARERPSCPRPIKPPPPQRPRT